ncbi:MAG: prolyl oligopeptidase family serine peptidase [Verrucomicrobia bacterium]|nr:prolyl oligopeptidase family serine peptidase [Verrucomicrobiota bacterium]
MKHPRTHRVGQVDDYHGTRVADPFRWLENPDSPESRRWIEAQNVVTSNYLAKIPSRAALKERLTKLWNYERFGLPYKEGQRYFYSRNDGLQNQAVLYSLPDLDAPPQVLLDPNTLSKDGTVALKSYVISHDGTLMAYGLSAAGSDWEEWRLRDVATAKDRPDVLTWVKFSSASWSRDGKGFFYSRYAEPDESTKLQSVNFFQKLYYHRVGTVQSEDILVYERPDQKEWKFDGEVTEDGRWLVITCTQGTDVKNRVLLADLKSGATPVTTEGLKQRPVRPLLMDFDSSYNFVGNDGSVFYFQNDLGAPRGRLIAIDIDQPERARWRVIIPESLDTLSHVSILNHQFITTWMHHAHSSVRVYNKLGKLIRDVELPGLGTASGFSGHPTDTETFFSFASFTQPSTIYRHNLATGESKIFRSPVVQFNPKDFETSQVFYQSKDGTRVPMFISHKKGLELNGQNPTLLYGYGGFNISLTPAFSPVTLAWMQMGGVYAQPNLRGGGEYGEDWHQSGTKLRKQNVFDDFIAAAEWLIEHQYTSSRRLAISGGSNGGLLVGACLTQRPELFGACLPAVGVLDMLRFHKFTIGWAWVSDYGSSEDADQFRALYRYSPLHNIKQGRSYPPTMILTADHDDRVVPAHSFKFGAALQSAQSGPAPILLRIDRKAGHGAGKPTSKLIEEAADRFAFLFKSLRIDPHL